MASSSVGSAVGTSPQLECKVPVLGIKTLRFWI